MNLSMIRSGYAIATLMLCTSLVGSHSIATAADTTAFNVDLLDLGESRPYIQLYGGTTELQVNGYTTPIHPMTAGGIRLAGEKSLIQDDIVRRHNSGVFIWGGPAAKGDGAASSIGLIRFGSIGETMYGYQLGTSGSELLFVHGTSPLAWSVLSPDNSTVAGADSQAIHDFGTSIRFGNAWSPGVELRIGGNLGIRAMSEWGQIYPRHMFWYAAGSDLIEGLTQAGISAFVKSVAKHSPKMAPVVHFLLTNGVSWGFKQLRRDNMNWPFSTAAPMNVFSYRIGLSYTF